MCVSLSLNLNVSPFLSENYSRFLAQSEQSLPSRSWCNMLATTPRGRKVNFEEVKEFLIKLKVLKVKRRSRKRQSTTKIMLMIVDDILQFTGEDFYRTMC